MNPELIKKIGRTMYTNMFDATVKNVAKFMTLECCLWSTWIPSFKAYKKNVRELKNFKFRYRPCNQIHANVLKSRKSYFGCRVESKLESAKIKVQPLAKFPKLERESTNRLLLRLPNCILWRSEPVEEEMTKPKSGCHTISFSVHLLMSDH